MKLVFFTDCHIQPGRPRAQQFCVQPFYRGDMREVFLRLKKASQDADAIIFGGDATHGGGRESTDLFFEMLATAAGNKPVYIVMGNHDSVDPAFEENFHRAAEPYPNVHLREGLYPLGDLDLVLLNNSYLSADGVAHPFWRGDCFPVPVIEQQQADRLERWLAAAPDRPAIVVIHCPAHTLPPVLVDFSHGILAGMQRYRDMLHAIFDRHPRVSRLLAGHVHFTGTYHAQRGPIHQCLASFAEYPCPVRVLEGPAGELKSRLISLADPSEAETIEHKK
jgi:3',5'-cyclic AMP phosphodiesterase CpdA